MTKVGAPINEAKMNYDRVSKVRALSHLGTLVYGKRFPKLSLRRTCRVSMQCSSAIRMPSMETRIWDCSNDNSARPDAAKVYKLGQSFMYCERNVYTRTTTFEQKGWLQY